MSYVEYDANNSGGDWWLSDEDWKALEEAGWIVKWIHLIEEYDSAGVAVIDAETGAPMLRPATPEDGFRFMGKVGDRWLGALATRAYRGGLPLSKAVAEWERITGQDSTDAGCACCGTPHNFTEYDDSGKCVASGPHASYSASW